MWFNQPGDERYIVCQTKPQINNDVSFCIIKFSLFAVFYAHLTLKLLIPNAAYGKLLTSLFLSKMKIGISQEYIYALEADSSNLSTFVSFKKNVGCKL